MRMAHELFVKSESILWDFAHLIHNSEPPKEYLEVYEQEITVNDTFLIPPLSDPCKQMSLDTTPLNSNPNYSFLFHEPSENIPNLSSECHQVRVGKHCGRLSLLLVNTPTQPLKGGWGRHL